MSYIRVVVNVHRVLLPLRTARNRISLSVLCTVVLFLIAIVPRYVPDSFGFLASLLPNLLFPSVPGSLGNPFQAYLNPVLHTLPPSYVLSLSVATLPPPTPPVRFPRFGAVLKSL